MDAHEAHQRDVLHDLFLQRVIDHCIAAVLHDDRLAVEILDIRKGFHEDIRGHRFHSYLLLFHQV